MDKKVKNPSEENEDALMKNVVMKSSVFTKKLAMFLVFAIVLGVMTGYALSKRGGSATLSSDKLDSASISKGTVVGSDNTKIFKDTAEGTLKGGGINGEGQYHLVRPGGESQNVYLTSSHVDLSKFVAKKIKVWGETQKAQYAGWLMDVGRVEVL